MAELNKGETKQLKKSLEELVLDTKYDKYKLVPIAARWAVELKKKEEYRNVPITEILSIALEEILTQKISYDEIEKLPPVEIIRRNPKGPEKHDYHKGR